MITDRGIYMGYTRTEAIIFDKDGTAYQVTAYIGSDGQVVTPNGSELPEGSILWRDRVILKIVNGKEYEITEGELPDTVAIKGKFLDQYRK